MCVSGVCIYEPLEVTRGIGSSGDGVKESDKLPCGFWKLKVGLLGG